MAENNNVTIRVTADDLAAVDHASQQAATPVAPAEPRGARSYGNVNAAAADAEPVRAEERGSVLLQGWFYLGAAGLVGAVAGWGICEPHFIDGGNAQAWGNIWLLPLVVSLMLICFALAESIVERSIKKALIRLSMVIPLGVIFGFIFGGVANVIYAIALQTAVSLGVQTYRNPGWWLARAIAWAGFGVAAGLIYGLVGKSSRKAKYGVMGGAIGAFLGGFAFDPISIAVHQAVASRAFGLGLLGLASGAAMGFVESALKDRWLYVFSGPLAGKQFILYKASTTIGSEQSNDIYLFKDTAIAAHHAVIEVRGAQATLRSQLPVFVSGIPTTSHVLLNGETVQIGRYGFRYNERHR